MSKQPLPRFRTDVLLTLDICAADGAEAADRLAAIQAFVADRLNRSTFRRMAGTPDLVVIEQISDIVEV